MNDHRTFLMLLLLAVLLGTLLLFHPWLFLPLFHLRVLLVGFLPWITFFPLSSYLVQKHLPDHERDSWDGFLYASFLSLVIASGTAFLLLTFHLAYPGVLLGLSALFILTTRQGWRDRILQLQHLPFDRSGVPLEKWFLVMALFIALSSSLLPPLGYDAHEYHLAVPQHYLTTHGWTAFPLNVYAAFPMNIELLYLWPLAVQSAAGCTVINFWLMCLTAMTVWRLGQQWGIAHTSWIVPLLFLSTGLVQRLVIQANIDLGLSASAAMLILAYERYRKKKNRLDFWMMGIALGFAFGAKYIALLSIGIPFLIMASYDGVFNKQKAVLFPSLLSLGIGFLFFLPWAIRNGWLYHNPVYPLLHSVLGGMPAFYSDMFDKVHAPRWESLSQGWIDFFLLPIQKSIRESLPVGFSSLWMVGIPIALRSRKDYPLVRSCIFMIVAYITWFFCTQRNDRFLASILPFMALLAGYGIHSIPPGFLRRIIHILMFMIVGSQLYGVTSVVITRDSVEYLLKPSFEDTYLAQRLPHFSAINWLNKQMASPRSRVGKVLFIGEAQTYSARFPTLAPTVFNHHPLETGLDSGVTHILYNGSELDRLQNSYAPYGWPLGDFLEQWLEQNNSKLTPVFDAYPDVPGRVVVYEIQQ